ncbi:MAG: hypothetical protein H6978_09090 [Gammaproteobacteria bacterium]|nr:hypothetical protein [Gammaproteobacteria bacterium]
MAAEQNGFRLVARAVRNGGLSFATELAAFRAGNPSRSRSRMDSGSSLRAVRNDGDVSFATEQALPTVIPAQAGIHTAAVEAEWIPARCCAPSGMTEGDRVKLLSLRAIC